MNLKRKRKRRVTSMDMCSCGDLFCDPMMGPDTPAKRKIKKRLKLGLCMGCGKKKEECSCKHKGPEDYSIPVSKSKYKRHYR